MGSYGSQSGPIVDSGEQGNKLLGSMKCWEFYTHHHYILWFSLSQPMKSNKIGNATPPHKHTHNFTKFIINPGTGCSNMRTSAFSRNSYSLHVVYVQKIWQRKHSSFSWCHPILPWSEFNWGTIYCLNCDIDKILISKICI